jgi:site-specific DNA-adenine methylase
VSRRFRCLFSYYGSKSKVAPLYPRPQHPLIIEPFAGGGCYSLLWGRRRQVLLNDLSEATYQIWDYLISTDTETVLADIPKNIQQGDRLEDLVPKGRHPGLMEFLRAQANMGVAGRQTSTKISKFGAINWARLEQAVKQIHPHIKHWEIRKGSYRDLENVEATWFIDPPYNNEAGSRYIESASAINFTRLGKWCKRRKGQVIVCENEGADWLPFRPLVRGRPRGGYIKRSTEVIWTNTKTGLLY